MRLIDADAFERVLYEELLPELTKRYCEKEALSGLHFSFMDYVSNIHMQPTVEQEPKYPVIVKWNRLVGKEDFQKMIDILRKQLNNVMLIPMDMDVVHPVRIKGKWLRYGEDGNPNETDTVFWQCDQCLESYTGRAKKIPNFCPNCGADMRGGDQDEIS